MKYNYAKDAALIVLTIVVGYFVRDQQLRESSGLQTNIHSVQLPPQIVNAKLKAHTSEFDTPEIIAVTDGVWVAVGYGLANSVMIEADNSLIIIDTLESVETASQARADFASATPKSVHSKPISTIIYTHYHADHTFGTAAYIDDELNPPTIISHPKTLREMSRVLSITSSITSIRAIRQFGTLLHQYSDYNRYTHHPGHGHGHSHSHHGDGHRHHHEHRNANESHVHASDYLTANNYTNTFENSGIGPFLGHGSTLFTFATALPNQLLESEHTKMNIDGVELEIFYAPGETVDQIFLYLPGKRVLLPADNLYKTFPNIYAIRGSPSRNARDWVKSLDSMRSVSPLPKFMVPHHTRPIHGEETIQELLTIYRDGISYVHDQTVRWTNKGLTPDEMIPRIHAHMPARLKEHPYLQEFYGTIDWSVRGIFHSYLGWFSGDAVDLFPLSNSASGDFLLQLMDGDVDKILDNARQSIVEGSRDGCQWALKLSVQIIQSTTAPAADKREAKAIKSTAMQCMASHMTSANGRNYYLTSVLEDATSAKLVIEPHQREFALNYLSLGQIMASIRVRLKTELVPSDKQNISVCHDFYHTWFLLELREGIIEMFKGTTAEAEAKAGLEEGHGDREKSDIESDWDSQAYIDRYVSKEDCYRQSSLVTLCPEQVFRDAICATTTSPTMLYGKGELKVMKGNILDLVAFRSWFETD